MKKLKYLIPACALLFISTFHACKKTEVPVPDFSASATEISAGEQIDFTDLSSNEPTQWSWSFEGGVPFSSNNQNPKGIMYSQPGTYAVSLAVGNEAGTDTKTILGHITVKDGAGVPVADFKASSVSVPSGEGVDFTDLSTGNPTSWLWTFAGAETPSSTQQNPTGIIYKTAGTFSVTLAVHNGAGDDELTKAGYITVTNDLAPIIDFSASLTEISEGMRIDFTDESQRSPTVWQWTFEGGSPSISFDRNPENILYEAEGTYSVTLNARNGDGRAELTKTGYITVNKSPISDMKVVSNAIFLESAATKCPPAGGWGWNVFNNVIETSSPKITFSYYSDNFVSGDFVNKEGDDLDETFGNNAWPMFFVGGNGQLFDKMKIGSGATEATITDDLNNMIQDHVTTSPLATLALNYSISNGTMTIKSYVGFLKDAEGDYNVAVWVSEDKVMASQSGNTGGVVPHRYVLRTAADNHSVFGVSAATGGVDANTLITTQHTAEISESWTENNLTVAVILWKKIGSSYGVVNASTEIFTE